MTDEERIAELECQLYRISEAILLAVKIIADFKLNADQLLAVERLIFMLKDIRAIATDNNGEPIGILVPPGAENDRL